MIFPHAWLEDAGEILDPNFQDGDVLYFPGLRLEGIEELAKAMEIPKGAWCEDLPIFFRYGWEGEDHPELSQARSEAKEYVQGLLEKKAQLCEGRWQWN